MASIEQRPSGPRVIWRLTRPGDPQHRKKQYLECGTDEVAERAQNLVEACNGKITRDEAEVIVLGIEPVDTSTAPRFKEWWRKWLPTKTRISPGTAEKYESQLRLVDGLLADTPNGPFGDRPIDRITGTDIGALLVELRAVREIENGTVTRYYSAVFSAFTAAVKEGLIDRNPCKASDFERDQVADDDDGSETHVYLTRDEFWLIHSHMAPRYQDFIETKVGLGTRFSEITALQPRDLVHPTKRHPRPRLWIRRAWKHRRGGWYIGTTKGRQKRLITVDWDVWPVLLRNAEGKAAEDLLFAAPEGGRIIHSNFMALHWNPAVVAAMRCPEHPPASQESPLEVGEAEAGRCGDYGGWSRKHGRPCQVKVVPGVDRCKYHCRPARNAVSDCDCPGVLHKRPTPHDLRHTCVAWLFADPKVSVLAVSRYVGHATTSVTDTVYGGLMPSSEGALADAAARARSRSNNDGAAAAAGETNDPAEAGLAATPSPRRLKAA